MRTDDDERVTARMAMNLQDDRTRDAFCLALMVASGVCFTSITVIVFFIGGRFTELVTIGVLYVLSHGLLFIMVWIRVTSGDYPSPGSRGRGRPLD